MTMPRIIGIRHHSPACARLVAHAIAQDAPAAVLIEGPSDFNARLSELLLPHRLPVALYSYANHAGGSAQCWFPLVGYSPEWVALTHGQARGAAVRFIDLPHWQYRTLSESERAHTLTARGTLAPSHYARTTQALAERLRCDGDHALWDHLFESDDPRTPADFAALEERLATYFHHLRGDPAEQGTPQDDAREAFMARWLAWAAQRFAGQPVLVVCGGWHKRSLEALWPTLTQPQEPASPAPPDERAAGAYLVPYEYRQLEALGGYAAGMQSPLYYEWLMQHGAAGAAQRAVQAIVQRLRARQVPVSTSDFIAFEHTLRALARLRGHAQPLRTDVLDAAQSAFIKEALDTPAPWSGHHALTPRHHPALREALLALTGDARGQLADGTPLPPLVADVQARLAACDITLPPTPTAKRLDRRRPDDTPAAQTLWQLKLIGAQGIVLQGIQAPQAARGLSEALAYEEHWQLAQHPHWLPSLIEAAAHGATLDAAARTCLLARLNPPPLAPGNAAPRAADIAQALTDAVRAGLFDLGDALADALRQRIPAEHEHGALAQAGQVLLDVANAGFWGQDTRPVLLGALHAIGERLLWLLEGLDMAPPGNPGSPGQPAPTAPAAPTGAQAPETLAADVGAVRVLGGLLRLARAQAVPGLDAIFIRASLLRLAHSTSKPPALRGAAAGLAHTLSRQEPDGPALADDELIALARAVPPRTQLGDYLYGLFALTRQVIADTPALMAAVHHTLAQMSDEDFLVALPALRGAFAWFPPRERGTVAAQAAALLGLTGPAHASARARLTQLPQGEALYVQARQIEAQALAWAQESGLLDWLGSPSES